jgi:hypothetical protein
MLKFFVGIAAILLGLWLVFCGFAFASMVDPRLEDRAWWSEVLMQYRRNGEVWGITILGLVLIAYGMGFCIRIWRQSSPT